MRLLVHVEGETEESFVNDVLAPHLYDVGYTKVSARLLGNARQRARRGGIRSWTAVRDDILRHLRGDRHCLSTTMVDYYALPQGAPDGWPGRDTAPQREFNLRAREIEDALREDLQMDDAAASHRFIPFVLMHEFEALLFSDCKRFAKSISKPELEQDLQSIRDGFETPEHINDSPVTAPAKRICALMPSYQKPLYGVVAAIDIGIAAMRAECRNFDRWIAELERRAG